MLLSSLPTHAAPWLDSFGPPLLGGVLIGAGAALLLFALGRVAGISGILGSLLPVPQNNTALEVGWRVAFLLGLVAVGLTVTLVDATPIMNDAPRSTSILVVAGLLVGFGTRLGSGCTSGHGVCGMSRLSPRSIAATLTFITTGALTVAVVRALGGLS